MVTRREFMVSSAAGIVAMTGLIQAADKSIKVDKPLKILFLGGTGFLGPHTINYAIARGHEVTLFNRGHSKEKLFPKLESIVGNRDPKIDNGLDGLIGKKWDCVIDTSGYVPRIVNASSKLLSEQCEHYLFISSISVYSEFTKVGLNENSAVGTLKDTKTEIVNGDSYGPLKAYCEAAAEKNFKNRTTVIRPGLIVGPRDRTDRYTYWPTRVALGGEVLAPGDGKDFVQYIDVRDLGAFIIHSLEKKSMGIFNATSQIADETTKEMLDYCKQGSASDAKFTWVNTDFLQSHGVQAWSGMPVWVPRQGEMAGLSQVSVDKALKQGLTIRPRKETVQDTLNWYGKQSDARRNKLRAGISHEKELQVLNAWHNHLRTTGS